MDVEVLVSWCKDILEGVLVLRCSRPGRMRRWGGDHHEEWLGVGLVVQEVQGDIGLKHRKTGHLSPHPAAEARISVCSLVKGAQGPLSFLPVWPTIYVTVTCKHVAGTNHPAFRQTHENTEKHTHS